jgi:8-oxo-dGTP diphosphatase
MAGLVPASCFSGGTWCETWMARRQPHFGEAGGIQPFSPQLSGVRGYRCFGTFAKDLARRPNAGEVGLAALGQSRRNMDRLMSHRNVAVVILYDGDGRILLQHRTVDAPTFPDHWAFFGGGLEAGETPEQAVEREIIEELAYTLRSPRRFASRQFLYDGFEHTMHVFLERYDGSPLVLGEGQGMGWFLPEQTIILKMNDHDRDVISAVAVDISALATQPPARG